MLPKIQSPTFKVRVPSLNRDIYMRPFLVKEEKILLLAKQSNDKEQIFLSLNQVLQNCIVDDDIDVLKLPYYDVEFLFITLRLNSIGESVDVEVTDPDTNQKVSASVDLNSIKIADVKQKITLKLENDSALVMKYPTVEELSKVDTSNNVNAFFETLMYSIKSVFVDDQSYEFVNYSFEEKMEFLESLSVKSINICREFIEKMPTVSVDAVWLDVDGNKKTAEVKGIQNFF